MAYKLILIVLIALFTPSYCLNHNHKYYEEKFEEFQNTYNKQYKSVEEKKYKL